jgi:hypothetical protein
MAAGRALDVAMLACLLGLGATLHFASAPEPPPPAAEPVPSVSGFPPAPPVFEPPAAAVEELRAQAPALWGDGDGAIADIARWATVDSDPLRRTFANSADLYGFLLNHIPAAQAGDGAAAYYVYLALDECRPYLRLGPEEARALIERMEPSLGQADTEERQSWLRDSLRCYRFAGADLGVVTQVLGADRPGAESEYGSVLFERAANAGFAPALAERALREPDFASGERKQMLQVALGSGNADVYWQLFRHAWSAQSDEARTLALAWLIEACRNGYDCGSQAPWFRAGECADGSERCLPAQSALAHYWYRASPIVRDAAFAMAQDIDVALARARWDEVPLPLQAESAMNGAPSVDIYDGAVAEMAEIGTPTLAE